MKLRFPKIKIPDILKAAWLLKDIVGIVKSMWRIRKVDKNLKEGFEMTLEREGALAGTASNTKVGVALMVTGLLLLTVAAFLGADDFSNLSNELTTLAADGLTVAEGLGFIAKLVGLVLGVFGVGKTGIGLRAILGRIEVLLRK